MQTNDPVNVADYQISIIGSVPTVYMNPTYEEELIIVLHVRNNCQTDEVTPLSSISD